MTTSKGLGCLHDHVTLPSLSLGCLYCREDLGKLNRAVLCFQMKTRKRNIVFILFNMIVWVKGTLNSDLWWQHRKTVKVFLIRLLSQHAQIQLFDKRTEVPVVSYIGRIVNS